MQIKMLEYLQGNGVSGVSHKGVVVTVLAPSETYEVGEVLAKWAIDNRKAVAVEKHAPVKVEEVQEPERTPNPDLPHYGATSEGVEIVEETPAPETPIMTTSSQPVAPVATEKTVIEKPRATTTHTRHGGKR